MNFMKSFAELQDLNYSGTIRYSGFVEPLLDKNIFNLLRMVRNFCQILILTCYKWRCIKFKKAIKII